MHRYKRYGETELTAISRKIESVSSEWCSTQLGEDTVTACTLFEASQFGKHACEGDRDWIACSIGKTHLYFSYSEKWPEKLAAARNWSGPSNYGDSSPLWDRTVLKSVHSLAITVLASLTDRRTKDEVSPEGDININKLNNGIFKTGSGYLVFQIGTGSASLFLLIPPDSVGIIHDSHFLGSGTQTLASRQSLLHNEKVILEVVAGSVEVTLGDIRNLNVGNVIRLESSVGMPIPFRCIFGTAIGGGYLASINGYKAIHVTKTLKQ